MHGADPEAQGFTDIQGCRGRVDGQLGNRRWLSRTKPGLRLGSRAGEEKRHYARGHMTQTRRDTQATRNGTTHGSATIFSTLHQAQPTPTTLHHLGDYVKRKPRAALQIAKAQG